MYGDSPKYEILKGRSIRKIETTGWLRGKYIKNVLNKDPKEVRGQAQVLSGENIISKGNVSCSSLEAAIAE